MMAFVGLKNALDALLIAQAADRFAVLGARGQTMSADKINAKRQVLVYFDGGDLSKSEGDTTGQSNHSVILKVELRANATAKIDLDVIKNPDATAAELTAALAAMQPASDEADELIDDLISIVWDIIMNPLNRDLGLDEDPDLWVTRIDKGSPAPRGSLVALDASLTVTATVIERPTGETPITGHSVASNSPLTADQSGEFVDSAHQGVEVPQ